MGPQLMANEVASADQPYSSSVTSAMGPGTFQFAPCRNAKSTNTNSTHHRCGVVPMWLMVSQSHSCARKSQRRFQPLPSPTAIQVVLHPPIRNMPFTSYTTWVH
jgi:hypothetical protein